jgi:hypothetical protein
VTTAKNTSRADVFDGDDGYWKWLACVVFDERLMVGVDYSKLVIFDCEFD